MIKNIIFDVGRVLIDWTPNDTMLKLGFSEEDIAAINNILFVSGEWNEEDLSVRSPQEMEDYFASLSSEYSDKIRLFYRHAVDSAIPRKYSIPLLDALNTAGYNTYILSNFGQFAKEKLEKRGVFEFLNHTNGHLFSYEIHKIKPDKEIYEALLNKYSLNPSECIFIDDVKKNIEGAKKLGIKGIQFIEAKQVFDELKSYNVNFEQNFII